MEALLRQLSSTQLSSTTQDPRTTGNLRFLPKRWKHSWDLQLYGKTLHFIMEALLSYVLKRQRNLHYPMPKS